MSRTFIFSSESVGEGHPDKVCDTISDAVLDACLAQDKHSRVACETYAKSNIVVVGGEITTQAKIHVNQIVRDAVREIGYVNDDYVFHADRPAQRQDRIPDQSHRTVRRRRTAGRHRLDWPQDYRR